MGGNQLVGMFLLGIAIGQYLPSFPEPLGMFQQYLGVALVIIAIIFFVRS
jgi:hypothetical protein